MNLHDFTRNLTAAVAMNRRMMPEIARTIMAISAPSHFERLVIRLMSQRNQAMLDLCEAQK